jgi:hypothetical protein
MRVYLEKIFTKFLGITFSWGNSRHIILQIGIGFIRICHTLKSVGEWFQDPYRRYTIGAVLLHHLGNDDKKRICT